MSVTVRFAPSPTGFLHVGNVRTALYNWLFARARGGRFMLRLDDTDTERSREDYAEAIRRDLTWLGLVWTVFDRQSARMKRYAEAAEALKKAGRLYPCYETQDELERKRKRQLARGLPPVYDRAALKLTVEERTELEKQGRTPHWRFRLEGRMVTWQDGVRGEQGIDTTSLSDPVLIRADGRYLYTLPSVVDDIDFAISHIIRGEDHVANSGAQIEIFEALQARPPRLAHHSLLTGAGGEGLSKRTGALSIASLREWGIEAMALNSLIARLGSSDAIEPCLSLDELAAGFDFAKLGRAPARFDEAELRNLNAKMLHMLSYDQVRDRLQSLDIAGGENFWLAVRANCERLSDVLQWWRIIEGPLETSFMGTRGDERAFLNDAAQLMPPEPFTEDSWMLWTKAVARATGRKGKALFEPLRLALTGRDRGPEMQKLLLLIGRQRALARLHGEKS
jgi:glutamyl-tRNA synthetase